MISFCQKKLESREKATKLRLKFFGFSRENHIHTGNARGNWNGDFKDLLPLDQGIDSEREREREREREVEVCVFVCVCVWLLDN